MFKEVDIVIPRKLVHSGKARAYPSSYIWDCPKCSTVREAWNIWKTRSVYGKPIVSCQWCHTQYILDKANVLEEITRTKNQKTII